VRGIFLGELPEHRVASRQLISRNLRLVPRQRFQRMLKRISKRERSKKNMSAPPIVNDRQLSLLLKASKMPRPRVHQL
jgi:hypothetical protein